MICNRATTATDYRAQGAEYESSDNHKDSGLTINYQVSLT